jgi:LacI family transcriptional regulator
VITMSDVAREAGVSISTVSHVVNGTRHVDPETHERVRGVIAQLGYRHNHLARAVARGGRTQSVGVALSARSNPYFAEVVTAIDRAVTALGSTMLLGETGDDAGREYQLITSLLERRVDGIIVSLAPDALASTAPLLEQSSTPAVLIDRMPTGRRLDEIGTDNLEPTARLVDHLAQVHGHRRIALLSGLAGLTTTDERCAGYQEGLRRNGCDTDEALIASGQSSSTPAEEATERLLTLAEPPTAIIAANNGMTVGMLRHLKHRGVRVPEDIAVCGFDDFEWAELMASPLTCIDQDWTEIGRGAVALLEERLRDAGGPVRTRRVPTTLILRNSCGCSAAESSTVIPLTEP